MFSTASDNNKCKSMMRTFLMLVTTSITSTYLAPAYAADLLENPVIEDSVVRLADIFSGTAEKGNEIVMQAPEPGKRLVVTSYELDRLAKAYELDWERPVYLKRIYLQREGEAFTLDDLEPIIKGLLQENGVHSDVEIKLYGRQSGHYLPVGYSVEDITWKSFTLSDRKDRFIAVIEVPTGDVIPNELRLTGSIQEVSLMPVLNRMITPGEIITKSDISWEKQPTRQINRNSIVSSQQLIGQTVSRALQVGSPLRTNDIATPVMIEKGAFVTMTFQQGALLLSVEGRALDDGGKGDIIRVMNSKSKQSLEAKVISPSTVEVQSSAFQQVATR
ncbi:flagellar basal body P-ring formation chaperone FlgA [Kordiimonas pumila]|uniref:Flagellar basal body P-ring formation chaperone FlgA n=1 Tax=Kordiimonas pumila TaxID=2161677 RepID=A0ABV7D250_9PROT|nr:flagellar basal body P-ring formation chaperone FlgA [Kordiimonas pumila]